MNLLEKKYYILQDIADEINALGLGWNSCKKDKEITSYDILEQGAQGKITINADLVYRDIPLGNIREKKEKYKLSFEDCKTVLLKKQIGFQMNFITSSDFVRIEQLYVLKEEKERFMLVVEKKMKKLNLVEINSQYAVECLNENHKNFAPELKIAIEAWQDIFSEKTHSNAQAVSMLLNQWLKKQMRYNKLTDSQIKRITTVITPKNRKQGGVISVK